MHFVHIPNVKSLLLTYGWHCFSMYNIVHLFSLSFYTHVYVISSVCEREREREREIGREREREREREGGERERDFCT